jgi:hypothetical protein
VTGEGGIRFENLLDIAADSSPCRFSGNHKDFGLYTRGIEEGNGKPARQRSLDYLQHE